MAKTNMELIKTEAENERALTEIHGLMLKGENLSAEDSARLESLSTAVVAFEKGHYAIEPGELCRHVWAIENGIEFCSECDIAKQSVVREAADGK